VGIVGIVGITVGVGTVEGIGVGKVGTVGTVEGSGVGSGVGNYEVGTLEGLISSF
jgi:hypothetical protein